MTPVTGEGFLLAFAQIALAFAGFSGIIISIRQKPEPAWLPWEVAGLKFILGHCFGAVILALIPFVTAALSWEATSIWRFSDLLLGLFLAAEVIVQVQRIRKAKLAGAGARFPRALFCAYIVPTEVISLLALWQVPSGSLAVFLFGLLWLLFQSGVQFSLFLHSYIAVSVVPAPERKVPEQV